MPRRSSDQNNPSQCTIEQSLLGIFKFVGNIITGEEIARARGKARSPISQPWLSSSSEVPVSSSLYANGANQNVGNVITNRPMIRINAPPGGASTFSIAHMFSGSTNRSK